MWKSLFNLHESYGPLVRVGPGEVSVGDFQLYRKIYSQNSSTKEDSFYRATTLLGHENLAGFRYTYTSGRTFVESSNIVSLHSGTRLCIQPGAK